MKYLIFSDIHGNFLALEELVKQPEFIKADVCVFCGDIFGYFNQQKKIIDYLMHSRVKCVKGNHELLYINAINQSKLRNKLLHQYGSSYNIKLSSEQLGWIKNLPEKLCFHDEGKRVCVVHGGISDFLNERIYPDTKLDEQYNYAYIITGHTHYRMLRHHMNCVYVNPGSLGQPRDGNGYSYALLDTSSNTVEFKSINIDTEILFHYLKCENNQSTNYQYLIQMLNRDFKK